MHIRYWWENQKEIGHWEYQDVSGWILDRMGLDGMDWVDMAQDGDQWRALVNTVKNLSVP
jgi:hypothetical protein